MLKVLILTVTAGNGHNSCARSMKEKLESLNHEVNTLDMLKEFSTPLNCLTVDKGYNFAVAKALPIYNMFWSAFKEVKLQYRFRCAFQGVANSTVAGLYKYICQYQPDVIFCTHAYSAIALTNLRLVYNIPAKVILSVLDYCVWPFMEAATGVDFLTVPNDDFHSKFLEKGFLSKQLVSTGVPVNEKFNLTKDKEECRAKYGLDEKLFTIMVMFGGGQWAGGFGIFKDVVRSVAEREVQIVMINGHDSNGFKKVERMKRRIPPNIKILNVGFTKEVDEYMSLADVIVTKMGGLSSTETANKALPMIVTENLTKLEELNLDYFKLKGVAKSFANAAELKQHLNFYIDNPNELRKTHEEMKKMSTNGISECSKLILSCPKAVYNQEEIAATNFAEVYNNVKKAVNHRFKHDQKTARKKEPKSTL